MSKQYYQQGDVLLFKVDGVELDKKNWGGKKVYKNLRTPILQHGEATGHAHRIESPGFALYGSEFTETKVLVLKTIGVLRHEEHHEIKLPRGIYEIRIVREYDHFQKVSRKVRD